MVTTNKYTDAFNIAVQYLKGKSCTEHSDIEISLLLKQYYSGESVKIELKNKLEDLGLM